MIAMAAVEFIPLPIPHNTFQNKENKTNKVLLVIQVTDPRPNIEIIYKVKWIQWLFTIRKTPIIIALDLPIRFINFPVVKEAIMKVIAWVLQINIINIKNKDNLNLPH